MAPTYFIQMSGVPGSGKSSLAKELAEKLAAVVLDHDDTKSAILKSGVAESEAGAASYEVVKALSARMVEHGRSVIIDSPCLYRELLDHGVHTAERHGARYKYIECQLRDLDELDRRLRSRIPKPSQVHHLDQAFSHAGATPRIARDLVVEWIDSACRPSEGALVVDTSQPIRDCVLEALSFITESSARRRGLPPDD